MSLPMGKILPTGFELANLNRVRRLRAYELKQPSLIALFSLALLIFPERSEWRDAPRIVREACILPNLRAPKHTHLLDDRSERLLRLGDHAVDVAHACRFETFLRALWSM
jgi:hypothetical protein